MTTLTRRPRLLRIAALAALLWTGAAGAQDADPDWTMPARGAGGADGAADAAVLAAPVAALDAGAFDWTRAMGAAVARTRHFGDAELDIESLAVDLMLDPQAAFALVRDRLRTEPYAGHLRDPAAVLAAQGGNAADKAATLAGLLAAMGYDARLVRAPAPDGMAQAVAARACTGRTAADPQVWRLAGLPPAVMARVAARARANFAALDAAMPPAAATDDGARADDTPHVWVQMRQGADWVDLDPALPETAFGDAPAGPGTPLADPVPAHRVRIRLQVETLRDGRLTTTDALDQAWDAADLADDRLTLAFMPDLPALGGTASVLGRLQGGGDKVVAILAHGDDITRGRPFAVPGGPAANPAADPAGGFFAAGADDDGAVVTALRLVVEATSPGRPDDRETRVLVDLVPPALRAAGQPLAPADLAAPPRGDRLPAALESRRDFVVSTGGLSRWLASVRMAGLLLDFPDLAQGAEAGAIDPDLAAWASWAQAATIAVMAEELVRARPPGPGGACTVIDRPRMFMSGAESGPDGAVGLWFDWTLDGVGVVGGDADDAARLRLWHGATSAALEVEALLWQVQAPADAAPPPPGPLAPLTAPAIAALGPEAADDAARGFAILGAPSLPAGTWWRLDPASGRADARFAAAGNGFKYWQGRTGLPATHARAGVSSIGQAAQDAIAADSEGYVQAALDELEAAERAEKEARRKPKGGANEYTNLLHYVSLPISVKAGVVIGAAVVIGLAYAIWG